MNNEKLLITGKANKKCRKIGQYKNVLKPTKLYWFL